VPVLCESGHNAEFVGVFPMPGAFDDIKNNRDTIHRHCLSLTAAFVGVPNNGDMKYRTGSAYLPPPRTQWDAGDQSIRCYLWQDTRNLTSSLKGGGAKVLPTN
jgi:hypothetical protein